MSNQAKPYNESQEKFLRNLTKERDNWIIDNPDETLGNAMSAFEEEHDLHVKFHPTKHRRMGTFCVTDKELARIGELPPQFIP